MSPYHFEELLGVNTQTAPLSVVLEAMREKGLDTYMLAAENAQEEPLGCMIFCTDLELMRKLAAVLDQKEDRKNDG